LLIDEERAPHHGGSFGLAAGARVLAQSCDATPRVQDVDPGVDHSALAEKVPDEYRRRGVLPRQVSGGHDHCEHGGSFPLTRALYIGTTVYRILDANAPETIGQAVSPGYFRLAKDDVLDLYQRVPVGTKVMDQ
jgi:hypothetical protein